MSDVQADVQETAVEQPVVEQPAQEPAPEQAPEQAATPAGQASEPVEQPAWIANAQPPLPGDHHAAAPHLASIEAIALTWGGDVGTMLRNLVGKIRAVL